MTYLITLAQGGGGMPPPSVQALGMWMLCLSVPLGVAYMIIKTFAIFRRRPPIDAQFATKRELKETEGKVAVLSEQVQTSYKDLERSDEKRASGLHKRMDDMLQKLSTVSGVVSKLPDQKEVSELKGQVSGLPCKQPNFKGCKS